MNRDDSALEQELANHLRDAAPAARGDTLSRLMRRVESSPQHAAWRVRTVSAAASLASGRSMGTAAVASGALVIGIVIGQLGVPAGLGPQPSPPATPTPTTNPAAWKEPENYSYVLDGCGPNDPIGLFRIHVANGVATGFEPLDERAQRYDRYPVEAMPTLGWIMARVAEAQAMTEPRDLPARPPSLSPPEVVDRSLPEVRLVTDPIDGHPIEVSIDWIPEAIDDELCYSIRDLQIHGDSTDQLVAVPTQEPRPTTGPIVCAAARLEGVLVTHPEDGLALRSGADITRVAWPHGFVARQTPEGLELLNAEGAVVAREGERVVLSGGENAEHIWHTCPGALIGEPSPFRGSAAQLLTEARKHIGGQVRVRGDVGIIAEGGPMLTLAVDGTGVGDFLVLIDTRLNDGLDYVAGEPADVEGTLLELTAENIDSVGNPYIDGADVIDFIRGPQYLIIATRVVQR